MKISGADSDFHRRDLWEAIEAGAYPGVGAGPADLHRRTGRGVHVRRARRHQDRARGARADRPGRPAGAEPQSGQLLRRDRAGGVLRRARRARHRLHERSAAGRPHPLLRRHADLAARRAELPRDPDQRARSRRCTTTSATACTGRRSIAAACRTSRTRSAAAVRSRPAPRASSRFRSLARTATTRCAARPSGSPITTRRRRCSGTARPTSRSSTSSTRSASSCRGCRRRRSASGWCRA